MDFLDQVRELLESLVEEGVFDGDVDDTSEIGDPATLAEAEEATSVQWTLFSEVLDVMEPSDDLLTESPGIGLLLRYLANQTDRVDNDEVVEGLPLSDLPKETAKLCDDGLVVAFEGYDDEVDALVVAVADEDDESLVYHCITPSRVATFDTPVALLEAMLDDEDDD